MVDDYRETIIISQQNKMPIHQSIQCSVGSVPVGVQCPLTSSLGEFPGYRVGSGILSFSPCWCLSIAKDTIESETDCLGDGSRLPVSAVALACIQQLPQLSAGNVVLKS